MDDLEPRPSPKVARIERRIEAIELALQNLKVYGAKRDNLLRALESARLRLWGTKKLGL